VVNKWKHIETSDKHMLNEWNRMVTNRKKKRSIDFAMPLTKIMVSMWGRNQCSRVSLWRQNKDFNDYLHRSDDDLRCDTTGRILLL